MLHLETESYQNTIFKVIEDFKLSIKSNFIDIIVKDFKTYYEAVVSILNEKTKDVLLYFLNEYDDVGSTAIINCIRNFEIDLEKKNFKFTDHDDKIYHKCSLSFMNQKYTSISNFKTVIEKNLSTIETSISIIYSTYLWDIGIEKKLKEEEVKENDMIQLINNKKNELLLFITNKKIECKSFRTENLKKRKAYEDMKEFMEYTPTKLQMIDVNFCTDVRAGMNHD